LQTGCSRRGHGVKALLESGQVCCGSKLLTVFLHETGMGDEMSGSVGVVKIDDPFKFVAGDLRDGGKSCINTVLGCLRLRG